VPQAYLDTNVFIYAFEGDPIEVEHLLVFFEFLQSEPSAATTSELTLAELFASTNPNHPAHRVTYEKLLLDQKFIELRAITRSVLIAAADFRKEKRLKLADAIHVATAVESECRYFVSADKDLQRLPGGLIHIRPTAEDIAVLLDSLRA
jgi:predicted nucleic acid-binding protein